MAFKLAEAYVELNSRGFNTVSSQIGGLASQFSGLRGALSSIAGLVPGVGTLMASLGLGAGAGGMLKLSADAEQTAISFEVLLGSADRAKVMIAELRDFAAATPFTFPGLADAGRTLLGFGVAAEQVMPAIDAISNVAAGNSQRMGQLALVYGQISAAGKLMGQDLLQLINAGFNPLETIAARTGETMGEVKDRMGDGAVTFDEVKQAFIAATSEGGRFYQMNEKQSRTLGGLFSTLQDTIGMSLTKIGDAIAEKLDLKAAIRNVTSMAEAFEAEWIPTIGTAVEWIARFGELLAANADQILAVISVLIGMAAAMKAITVWQQVIAAKQAIVLALTGPAGWAVLAAGVAAGVVAYSALNSEMDRLSESQRTAADEALATAAATQKQADATKNLAVSQATVRESAGIKSDKDMFDELADLQYEIDVLRGTRTAEQVEVFQKFRDGYKIDDIKKLQALRSERDSLKSQKETEADAAKQKAEQDRSAKEDRQRQLAEFRDSGKTDMDRYYETLRQIREFVESGDLTAAEGAAAREDALPQSIRQIREAARSPADRFRESVAKMERLKFYGHITEEEFDAAKAMRERETVDAMMAEREQQKPQGGFVGLADYANRIQESALRTNEQLLRQQLAAQLRMADALEEDYQGTPATAS